ncbi:hypothetical protein V6N11_036508 [Hibiscus sabdariffa]|uniref:Reverse transcriptase zinc-binding domain-containing protein n=1 Tax=Hibiscus sabdariffa TaxID=183260 RepID=A0ABR2RAK9_9ROSI
MTTTGSWNLTLLLSLFPEQVTRRIFSQRCPSSNDIIDFCRWRWSPQFSISEAYSKILEEEWDAHSNDWHVIWSLLVSQRIRVFIWLALRQKLMTNMERHRQGLTENPSCTHCDSVESIDHILRGCLYARNVWSLIFGANQITITFFTDDMKSWLLTNLRSNASLPYSMVPWNTLFATICWHIWKARNEIVFTSTCQTSASLIHHSLTWAKHFAKSVDPPTLHSQPTSPVSTLQWRTPPQHWSITDAFTAELWAILDGLNLAWQLGLEFIQVQTYCSKAVSEITSRDAYRNPLALIRSIHALGQRVWVVEFIRIPHGANQVADRMTKLNSFSQFDMVLFTNPPAQVQDLLAKDVDSLTN